MDSLAYLDTLSPQESAEISKLLLSEPRGEITNPFPPIELQPPKPLNSIDVERFRLALPASDSLKDWEAALANAKSCFEYSNNRILELELLLKYGTPGWKSKTLFLSQLLQVKEAQLLEKRSKIDEINRERKESQLYISGTLKALEKKYQNLLKSHLQVTNAVFELEQSLARK